MSVACRCAYAIGDDGARAGGAMRCLMVNDVDDDGRLGDGRDGGWWWAGDDGGNGVDPVRWCDGDLGDDGDATTGWAIGGEWVVMMMGDQVWRSGGGDDGDDDDGDGDGAGCDVRCGRWWAMVRW